MSIWVWIGVALLGGSGALARFTLDTAIAARSFPVGTLAINLSGALALGFVTGLAVSGDALLLIGTATLGSYTTFSTWMLESHRLTEDRELPLALLNILLSLLAGVGAAALGRLLGAHL